MLSISHRISSRFMAAVILSMAGISLCHAESTTRPRLVVGIMIDGLRSELIDQLRPYFSDGGFNRLLDKGLIIANADYGTNLDAAAATAMLMTGATPSVNGVPAAFVYDPDARRLVPTLLDDSVIGNYTTETYSPRNLRVSTIADEVRIAGGGVTSAYAVAPDPQQAIILGGHAANSALWLNDATGNWATTTFYKDTPTFIVGRNRLTPLSSRLDTMSWTPLLKPETYPDLPDHLKRYPFRYVFPRGNSRRYELFRQSPLVNREVTDIATEMITALGLGSHDGVDMLNVAYTLVPFEQSKNPDSRFETMDAYLRLDRNLEKLFNTVDRASDSNSLIFVAATPPPTSVRRDDEKWNIPYGEFSSRKASSLLNMYLMAVFGNGDWVRGYHNRQFFLNADLIKEKNLDYSKVRSEAADFLARMSGVKEVFTIDQILSGIAGEKAQAFKRNTHIASAGDIFIDIIPGWEIIDDYNNISESPTTGKVQRVAAATSPAYIMGNSVKPARIDVPVDVRVIVPTVARILRIRSPNAASLPAYDVAR